MISSAVPTTANIAQGATRKVILISLDDDQIAEENDAFTLTVKDGTGYVPSDPDSATWTILDNDSDLPVLRITSDRFWGQRRG